MLEVVLDVVGLQAVQVRASPRGPVMQVVVDHVVHHVAAQSAHEHRRGNDIWENLLETHIEGPDHQGGQDRREDQAGAVKGGLWGGEDWVSCEKVDSL